MRATRRTYCIMCAPEPILRFGRTKEEACSMRKSRSVESLLSQSLPDLFRRSCGFLSLVTIGPETLEQARAPFKRCLARRIEGIHTLAFDVDGADHARALPIQNRNDDLRPSGVQCGQVVRIARYVTDIDGLALGDGPGRPTLCDGKRWIRRRSGSAPSDIGYQPALHIHLIEANPTIGPVLSNRIGDVCGFR